jgi:hypothetical protein
MDTLDDRMTLLERAQLLHDATLRRHSEILDLHTEQITLLRVLAEQQTRMALQLTEVSARLETTLEAIKDMLQRWQNGH